MSAPKIQITRNYSLFTVSKDNRKIETNKRGDLLKSMQAYGYLHGYPIMCRRENGKLVIIDGQHRFMIAQELGIAVAFLIEAQTVDVALINSGQRTWNTDAYVNRFIAGGKEEYVRLREFADLHHLPIHSAAGILLGQNTGTNATVAIKAGTFKATDWAFGAMVARVFSSVRNAAKECATAQTLRAITAICTIGDADIDRLTRNIARRADMLRRFNNRDACLDMFEAIYNDQTHAKNKRPLAFEARNALAERQHCGKNGAKKNAKATTPTA